VAVEILGVVLAFAVGMVLGFSQDEGAVLPRPPAVSIGIFNADLNVLRVVRRDRAFGDGEAAIASPHLYAVIGDAKADGEAKSLCQPMGGCARVWIDEHRNHGARRHGTIGSHWETLSFITGWVAHFRVPPSRNEYKVSPLQSACRVGGSKHSH